MRFNYNHAPSVIALSLIATLGLTACTDRSASPNKMPLEEAVRTDILEPKLGECLTDTPYDFMGGGATIKLDERQAPLEDVVTISPSIIDGQAPTDAPSLSFEVLEAGARVQFELFARDDLTLAVVEEQDCDLAQVGLPY